MQMIEHTVDVRGPSVSNGQRSPDAVGSVLKWVEAMVQGSVSMAFRYTSRARGRPPGWFLAACGVRFADISDGDGFTRLHFEAARLGEAAEEVYRQELFGTRPAESDTGFDLVGDVICDVARRVSDSHRFDRGLLGRVRSFRNARSRWGVQSLVFHGDRLPKADAVTVTQEVAECASALRAATPEPVRARLAGELDMIRASDGSFGLLVQSGETVHGVLVADETDTLRDLWRKQVVVEGRAMFRPSGSVLRIEAEGMAPASDADRFFARLPSPRTAKLPHKELRKPQSPTTGLGAIFGKWPGEETEEELLTALKEMS